MTNEVLMTPDGDVVWESHEVAKGVLTVSPEFDANSLPIDLEELIEKSRFAKHDGELLDFELIGKGAFGKVFNVGGYAIKCALGQEAKQSKYGFFSTERVIDQTRIAMSLHHGLYARGYGTPQIAAPRHFACWQETKDDRDALYRYSRRSSQLQIMELIPRDENQIFSARRIKKAGSRALRRVGLSPREVNWEDVRQSNVIVSGGMPYPIDIMPKDELSAFI